MDPELEREQAGAEPGVTVKRCVVCGAFVYLASDAPADEVENPRCVNHFFDADPTRGWESE